MSTLLEKAIAEISRLPEDQQDRLARWLLSELASEHQWDAVFESSQGRLAELAREALDEDRARRTEDFDPGRR
jgi:hypothetical protein